MEPWLQGGSFSVYVVHFLKRNVQKIYESCECQPTAYIYNKCACNEWPIIYIDPLFAIYYYVLAILLQLRCMLVMHKKWGQLNFIVCYISIMQLNHYRTRVLVFRGNLRSASKKCIQSSQLINLEGREVRCTQLSAKRRPVDQLVENDAVYRVPDRTNVPLRMHAIHTKPCK